LTEQEKQSKRIERLELKMEFLLKKDGILVCKDEWIAGLESRINKLTEEIEA